MNRWTLIALLCVGCGPSYKSQLALESQMEKEITALTQRNRLMKEQLKTCNVAGPPTALFSSLYQVYNKSPVEITRIGRITQLTFRIRDLFRSDGFTVREEMNMYLDLLATVLESNPDYLIRIEGHTDDSAIPYKLRRVYPDSWMLAMGRAIRLMDTLVNEFGVDESRFALATRGEFAPRDENDTDGGRARNNRIMVNLYPKGVDP